MNKVIEIETHGEKSEYKIYFKALDVLKGFEMPNLVRTLVHKDGNYISDIHYKSFICTSVLSKHQQTSKKQLYIQVLNRQM